MKKLLLNALAVALLLLMPTLASAQPTLGTTKNYVLFSGGGAVSNTGAGTLTLLTGNIGTNIGTVSSGFGNIDGVIHDNDGAATGGSGQATTDLTTLRDEIIALGNGTVIPHVIGFGGGEILPKGVYTVGGASTLDGILTLNGTATDVFVFIIDGSFSVSTNSQIILTGGATACNVFWQANGQIQMATGADMKGTYIAKSGAILMNGVTLEGRALALTGAITVSALKAKIPIGCASPNLSPTLMGPAAPTLVTSQCYVLFSSSGNVSNTVPATVFTGDIGTNLGTTAGFLNVVGTVRPGPDVSTGLYATDLGATYTYLNGLSKDIDLLYPVQLGNNLVLTPHTYLLSAATVLTGNLYLNAQNNADAVFVIQVNGAFQAVTGSQVILQNQAQSKNVYWKVTGAVDISSTFFRGTIVTNSAIDLKTGVTLDGRGLSISGVITTAADNVTIPSGCVATAIRIIDDSNMDGAVTIYPNPSSASATIRVNNASEVDCYKLSIYNASGIQVMTRTISDESTTLETENLPSGIYFYKVTGENKTFKSGKLVVQK